MERTKEVLSSVLKVTISKRAHDIERNRRKENPLTGCGTAFVTAMRGGVAYAATCYHVVEDASDIVLQESSSLAKRRGARIAAVYPEVDLALLEFGVEGFSGELRPLAVAGPGSAPPQLGESVFAVGFPLGSDVKVSSGNVSGYDAAAGDGSGRYSITVPVNPGNSGGPLLREGVGGDLEVIGVVDSKVGDREATSISFAVPSVFWERLAGLPSGTETTVLRTRLFGLCYRPLDGATLAVLEAAGVDLEGGVALNHALAHSDASLHLSEGDIISEVEVGGASYRILREEGMVRAPFASQPVPLAQVLARSTEGATAVFRVHSLDYGSGSVKTRDVELRATDAVHCGAMRRVYFPFEDMETMRALGVTLAPFRQNFVETSNTVLVLFMKLSPIERQEEMVIVSHVDRDSPAAEAGITPGALLETLNGVRVRSVQDVVRAMRKPTGGKLHVARFWLLGQTKHLAVSPEDDESGAPKAPGVVLGGGSKREFHWEAGLEGMVHALNPRRDSRDSGGDDDEWSTELRELVSSLQKSVRQRRPTQRPGPPPSLFSGAPSPPPPSPPRPQALQRKFPSATKQL